METLKYWGWLLLVIPVACSQETDDYSPQVVAEAFWHELHTWYAYPGILEEICKDYDYTGVGSSSIEERELAMTLGTILSRLRDGHANLYTPWGVLGNENYFDSYISNTINDYSSYFESYEILNACLRWGKIRNTSLAYLYIRSFAGTEANFRCMDSMVVTWIKDYEGLIIDVRGNRGGLVENGLHVASFFSSSVPCVGRFRRCMNGKQDLFTAWTYLTIHPAGSGSFRKPIVVLTDRFTFSAAEWFIIALARQSHVTTMGDTTGGGISIPVIRELPNGWLFSIPNTQFLSSEGIDFQFSGYPPDIPVILSPADKTSNRDTPLEYAIRCLMAKR